jgi:hypothetical protein
MGYIINVNEIRKTEGYVRWLDGLRVFWRVLNGWPLGIPEL